ARPGRRTLTKQRVLAAGQLLLRLDQGSTGPLDTATEHALIDALVGLFPRCDAVILSDYGYGILSPPVIQALADLQAGWGRVGVAAAGGLAAVGAVGAPAAKPNYAEALALVGAAAPPKGQWDGHSCPTVGRIANPSYSGTDRNVRPTAPLAGSYLDRAGT